MARQKVRKDLDNEEMELEQSLRDEPHDWVEGAPEFNEKIVQAAKESEQLKAARTNIRFTPADLEAIRLKADEERLPYQTLIASVMHKYVTGQLVDRKTIDMMLEQIEQKRKN